MFLALLFGFWEISMKFTSSPDDAVARKNIIY